MKFYGSQYWESTFSSRSWGRYPSEEAVRGIARIRNWMGNDEIHVLDIGCGQGALTWFMSKEGALVTAFDGSPSGLEKLKTMVSDFGAPQPVSLILGDITSPKDFVSQTYNVLVDHYSVYSNPSELVYSAYGDFYDLIRPSGFFLSCFFGSACSGLKTGTRVGSNTYKDISEGPHKGCGNISIYTIKELEGMYLSLGFEIVYYEHILNERDGMTIEKHITCLRRPSA